MYWRNSNFQYAYFVFGACHTPIEAHRKCMEAIDDRTLALAQEPKQSLLNFFKKENKHIREHSERLIKQANEELEFLYKCKERLEKVIGFVPTMEDYQNNQREEWKLELEARAENHLLCSGTIPAEHFVTMKMHPDFPKIVERINYIKDQIASNESYEFVLPDWKSELPLIEDKSNGNL